VEFFRYWGANRLRIVGLAGPAGLHRNSSAITLGVVPDGSHIWLVWRARRLVGLRQISLPHNLRPGRPVFKRKISVASLPGAGRPASPSQICDTVRHPRPRVSLSCSTV